MKDVRHVALYVLVGGVEGCWLFALSALLNTWLAEDRLSLPGLLAIFPVSFGVNRLLRRTGWHRLILRAISWLGWAVVVLLAVKLQLYGGSGWSDSDWLTAIPRAVGVVFYAFGPELLILMVGALLWQLGRRLAHTRITFATAVAEFQFGLAALLILFFVGAQLEVRAHSPIPLVMSFFALGLSGISLAHAMEGTSWLSGLYRERWVVLVAISLALVLLLGAFIAVVVDRDLLQVALDVLNWIWELTMGVIAFLMSLLPQSDPPDVAPERPLPSAGTDEGFELFSMPEWLRDTLRFAWGMLMLGLFVLALWRISTQVFMWLHRRLTGTPGTEFESLPGALRADLLRLLRGVLWLLTLPFRARRKPPAAVPLSPVRRIYRELLAWAAARGYTRRSSQTPHEYLDALSRLVPGAGEDLAVITGQYTAARYGAHRAGNDELCKVREGWYRVKRQRLKKRARGNNGAGDEASGYGGKAK